jgi:hypothetical protein
MFARLGRFEEAVLISNRIMARSTRLWMPGAGKVDCSLRPELPVDNFWLAERTVADEVFQGTT